MTTITRRTLIRNGGIAASVATVFPDNPPLVTGGEEAAGTVFHVFVFQWKAGTTEAQKDKAAKEITPSKGKFPDFFRLM